MNILHAKRVRATNSVTPVARWVLILLIALAVGAAKAPLAIGKLSPHFFWKCNIAKFDEDRCLVCVHSNHLLSAQYAIIQECHVMESLEINIPLTSQADIMIIKSL